MVYTIFTVLIILVCVLLVLVVLIQNSKGGGLSSGFAGSNQIMGVKRTTDFVEKLTYGLAIALVVLCLGASFSLPSKEEAAVGTSMQEQIDNATPAKAPVAPGGAQPAQQQPVQQQPAQQPAK